MVEKKTALDPPVKPKKVVNYLDAFEDRNGTWAYKNRPMWMADLLACGWKVEEYRDGWKASHPGINGVENAVMGKDLNAIKQRVLVLVRVKATK